MQTKLYELRKEKKMTQAQISKLLNISRTSYGKKERGIQPFNADEMFILAKMFNKTMDEIFLPKKHHNGNTELMG
jgi:putative transcriptional regulator